jgi:cysteine desulfurase / selenocysteine lyase
MAGYANHWAMGSVVKQQFASLTNLTAEDFALIGNASKGIARVVSSVDRRVGDNTVVADVDYASGRFSLARLASMGVENRVVSADDNFIKIEDLLAACDARTRLLYISHVNAHTGQRIDLKRLSESIDPNIVLLVDASHSLGVMPVDGNYCDFLVASTYKFLLGTHTGVLAWNQRHKKEFNPLSVGWHGGASGLAANDYNPVRDVQRAEIGNSNHLDVYMLRTSLDYLAAIPSDALESYVLDLAGKLRRGLQKLGLPLLTPESRNNRGPNVSFQHDNPATLVRRAAADKILLWGEAGRVRASVHVFVEEDDVDYFLDWMAKYL